MARQRNPRTRAVLLSDDESSRLLLRAQGVADAGSSTGATSPTSTAPPEVTLLAPTKARKTKLATAFRCPVCKRAETVQCRIDPRRKVAEASCCGCEASYSAAADALTEPIDVYCEWVDERRLRAGVRRDHDGDVMMDDA